MLALVASLAFLASTAAALPAANQLIARANAKDEAPSLYVSLNAPTPKTNGTQATYEGRLSNSKNWFTIDNGTAGWEINTSGDKGGFRLKGDDDSAVIYNLSANNTITTAAYKYDNTQVNVAVDNYLSINTAYTLDGPSQKSQRDAWGGSKGFKAVPLNQSVTVDNVMCDDTLTITVSTIDAKGATQSYNGTDHVAFDVPSALPANVTITSKEHPGTSVVLTYTGVQPLTAKLGAGNAPSISAGVVSVVQFCPD
ncbi:hypothetical protein PLICRDRAFT_462446 [Plicaturopsis crispa FD-325 SS-3]|nr:hypothetical protein PLICRDRAFT_462446 [Plicaturopsis crispa FD-325 SS-3]